MLVSRRRVLALAAAGTALAGVRLSPARAALGGNAGGLFVSACTTDAGEHRFAGFTAAGAKAFEVALPERGHGAARRPGTVEIVAFARRPGRFMAVIDAAEGRRTRLIESAPGRHFYGHGVFTADGRTLYAPENAWAEDDPGVIGIYDATDGYKRLGEMKAGGIGAHDLRLIDDDRTMVVAVGGILTNPDMGRAKLNLGSMKPSLTYLDRASGAVLEQVEPAPEDHQASMRHLGLGPDGLVVIVSQYEGDPRRRPPLVLMHRRGEAPSWLSAPRAIQAGMRNYCGSASVDATGTIAAVSHPRGNMVSFWSLTETRFLWAAEAPDGCGVAPDGRPGGFVITSGAGGAVTAADGAATPLGGAWMGARHWDNHLLAVT